MDREVGERMTQEDCHEFGATVYNGLQASAFPGRVSQIFFRPCMTELKEIEVD